MESIQVIITEEINKVINEVGEANLEPYQWSIKSQSDRNHLYGFQNSSGSDYQVGIYRYYDDWVVDFKIVGGGYEDVVNNNDVYKTMATVLDIIKYFITKVNPDSLVFEPSKNSGDDQRRFNIYMAYVKKLVPPEYSVDTRDNNELIVIQKKQGLDEVGEGSATPYEWHESFPVDGNIEYGFSTEDRDIYEIQMQDIGNYWNIDFKTRNGEFEDVVNKGRFFAVMATIGQIIKDFLDKVKPEIVRISPAKNSNADQRRLNIYKRYFEKQLPRDYEVLADGKYIYIQKI